MNDMTMRRMFCLVAAGLMLLCPGVLSAGEKDYAEKEKKESAVKEHIQNHYKIYGFVRNYMSYDSRESLAGTGDLFYYLPKDQSLNAAGEDMNLKNQFRYLSITSRLGIDVSGYKAGNTEFGGKIEADFYAGLSGVTGTATLRLRQAFMTIGWKDLPMGDDRAAVKLKIGQAWHPMAADICPVFTLEVGTPFGPFSRTPQITMDADLGSNFTLSASAIWQMQYTSTGPDGASANYMKYGCTPEVYLGVTAKSKHFLARLGVDMLSIKPRTTGTARLEKFGVEEDGATYKSGTVKVSDRITTFSPFVYLQYVNNGFSFKAKSIFASAGEHFNIQGGYGITRKYDAPGEDGHWEYAPTHSSSTWVTLAYGKKWVPMLFAGYYKNFGTFEDLYSAKGDGSVLESDFYFAKNSFKNLNQLIRVCPSIMYNVGKFFSIGLDYEFTAAQYGTPGKRTYAGVDGKDVTAVVYNSRGLATENMHWVWNHRVQAMFKFTF